MRFRVLPTLFCVGLALAVVSAASPSRTAPKAHVATRLVTFTLGDTGKGRWSTVGDNDQGSMAMNYNWRGTAKLRVSTAALAHAATAVYNTHGTATIVANWVGDYVGSQFGTTTAGPYHCTYKGSNVKIVADAQLTKLTKKGRAQLILTARPLPTSYGFFPTTGAGVSQQCANAVGSQGPPHFSPQTFFREAFNVGGQLTNQTAMIAFPGTVLPKGRVKVLFPRESGSVNEPQRPQLKWSNVGSLTLTAK